MFNYIVMAQSKAGEPRIGIPFKTNMDLFEFRDYISERCEKIHPNSRDVVWRYSTWELVNPRVFIPSEYVNFIPCIIEV